MSFGGGGGGYQGGRTRMKTNVTLNVYDLSPANDYLHPVGLGLHHSGVEILGTEYSFAGGAGIFEQRPREVPNARFREAIDMGHFDGGSSELRSTLDDLKGEFHGDSYNLIRKNCNHFANALVWALLRRTIPGHVNRLADLGSCCGCLLPKKMLEDSPVHAPGQGGGGGGGGGGSAGFQAIGPPGGRAGGGSASSSSGMSAFAGSGNKLGGTTSSSSSSSGGGGLGITGWIGRGGGGSGSSRNAGTPADDLTDRREKARKAALARLGAGAGAGVAAGDGVAPGTGSPSGTGEGYKRS